MANVHFGVTIPQIKRTSLQLQAIRMPGYRYYAEISRPIPTLLQGCVDVHEERYAAAFDFEIDLLLPETLVP